MKTTDWPLNIFLLFYDDRQRNTFPNDYMITNTRLQTLPASPSKTYPLLITRPILFFFIIVFPFSVGWTTSSTDFPLLQALPPAPSSSTMTLPLFPPLTTRSGQVYPRNYFEVNAADCLHCLQTVPEEQQWGTALFPIVVKAPEVEDDIFQRYYRWFINEGQD